MSTDSNKIENIQEKNLAATYNNHEEYFYACNNITTAIVKDIRQVKTDWQQIYQHNKQELSDLNERLRLFLNSFQTLEQHNSQLANEIETFQKQILNLFALDDQWNENYVSLQANLTTLGNEKYESESNFELSQLQIQIYEQLYKFFRQFNDERRTKLEQELQKLSATLNNLKLSYQTSEKEVEDLRVALENAVKQYLSLIREKCQLKKLQKQLNFNIQTLKSQLVCYKSIHAYAYQEAEILFGSAVDSDQYWSLELDKCIERIRRDFESLYASIRCSMVSYYDEKTIEMQSELEQTLKYQQSEQEAFLLGQQSLEQEYEQVQKSLSHEKEIQAKYEAELARLEADLKAIQLQHEKKFDEQNQLLTNGQEEIILMGQNIGEVRRSTTNLEAEIIIYRHLLESTDIRQFTAPPPTPSAEITEKVVVVNESKRKGPIGIKECAASGKYISLVNHSSTQDVDISKWTLKRRFDSSSDILYTIPEGTRLKHGKELTIYSKIGADALESSSSPRTMTMPNEELITDDLVSWGMGNAVETVLIDRNGEEKASHIQSLGFGTGHVYNE